MYTLERYLEYIYNEDIRQPKTEHTNIQIYQHADIHTGEYRSKGYTIQLHMNNTSTHIVQSMFRHA